MSFKRFLNSHFVFGNEKHISFFQGSSFRFAVIIFVSLPYLKKFSAKIQIFCGKAKPELVKVWALL